MVLSCVALSLVDVVGLIHFWGLTIDTISCVSVVLVIGLCIDYSAHIGHAFIVSTVRASTELRKSGLMKFISAVLIALPGPAWVLLNCFAKTFSSVYHFVGK